MIENFLTDFANLSDFLELVSSGSLPWALCFSLMKNIGGSGTLQEPQETKYSLLGGNELLYQKKNYREQ